MPRLPTRLAWPTDTRHSPWAERAKTAGYPERSAQEALGHNSKASPRACTKRALMKLPSLADYKQRAAAQLNAVA